MSDLMFIGCAGWALRTEHHALFDAAGSHLSRYASRFNAVEINSSFYKPHRPATYARWRASVPEGFRFSVKLPKAITHEQRLRDSGALLDTFFGQVLELRDRLGALLVQLPPSLVFDEDVADHFLAGLRARHDGDVCLEPRHVSWFEPAADALLVAHRVARVAADPGLCPAASEPGGWRGLAYFRLHGSPRLYYSAYGARSIEHWHGRMRAAAQGSSRVWCIFDNTAEGAATVDALDMQRLSASAATASGPVDPLSLPASVRQGAGAGAPHTR
ncbi:MAG: DUF72 domain-containing protein [Rubrivivax sp.]|nr:MAG: DUF72 domain-containing protein [Rubrivivax sp.]